MLKVYISSNGCEDGRLSSAYVEEFFRMNSCTIIRDSAKADLIVFYACGLTKASEIDSLGVIRKLQSTMRPTARLIVWGCLPKINPQLLATVYDGPVVGPKNLSFFEGVLEKTEFPMSEISANTLAPLETVGLLSWNSAINRFTRLVLKALDVPLWYKYRNFAMSTRKGEIYWIHAVKGCTQACTYCSDRCAWGRINSKPIDRIVSEFKRGLQLGYGNFYLVGSDLGAYGIDKGCTLPDLLAKLVRIDDRRNYKIILGQMNPLYLKEMFYDLEEIFNSGKIGVVGCQVQSGSNRILKLMGRRYTAEEWIEYMLRIRNKFPEISLQTHLMAGFPTETDEDFKATLRLLDKIFLDDITVFKFSRRPHVYASYIPGQIPEKIKDSRYKRLLLKATLNMAIRKTQRLMNS